MIVVGYQGIGKSTTSNELDNCIDLESGNFFVDGKRSDDWYRIYVNIANNLSMQGNVVFVSSHKIVRECLNERNIEFISVFPSLELKEAWLEKLKRRYDKTNSDKDYKAWKNAEEGYDEQIQDLMKEHNTIVLSDDEYDLKKIVMDIVSMMYS